MKNRILLFIPVGVFLLLSVFFFRSLGENTMVLESTLIGKSLPPFELPALNSPNKSVSDKDLKEKKYLINFWGTYCPPCHAEHPFLLELADSKQISIVGVSYHDDLNQARQFLSQKGNPFEYAIVDTEGRFGIDMGVVGPPETFLVDENGQILEKHVGMLDPQIWSAKFSRHFKK